MIYKDSVGTSQETNYVSNTESNQLILFGETVAVYCDSHKEHRHAVWKDAEFMTVKADGKHIYH
jgi:hypothetical protein